MSLWLPKTARRKVYACLVPGCGKSFGEHEQSQYVRHTASCSVKNEAEILELDAARRGSAFTSVLDEEQQRWRRQVRAGVRNPKSRGVIVDPVRTP